MAERVGFEPTVGISHARFPGVCLKPLSHLSRQAARNLKKRAARRNAFQRVPAVVLTTVPKAVMCVDNRLFADASRSVEYRYCLSSLLVRLNRLKVVRWLNEGDDAQVK